MANDGDAPAAAAPSSPTPRGSIRDGSRRPSTFPITNNNKTTATTASSLTFLHDKASQDLLKDLQRVSSIIEFRGWRQSFLQHHELFLHSDQAHKAEAVYLTLSHNMTAALELVLKLDQFKRAGLLTNDTITASGRLCVAEIGALLTTINHQQRRLLPGTQEECDAFGYNKFHIGAVLVADSFAKYDQFSACAQILQVLRTSLEGVADKQILAEMEAYPKLFGTFCDVLSDLGLYDTMMKCREWIEKEKELDAQDVVDELEPHEPADPPFEEESALVVYGIDTTEAQKEDSTTADDAWNGEGAIVPSKRRASDYYINGGDLSESLLFRSRPPKNSDTAELALVPVGGSAITANENMPAHKDDDDDDDSLPEDPIDLSTFQDDEQDKIDLAGRNPRERESAIETGGTAELGPIPVGAVSSRVAGGQDGDEREKIRLAGRNPREREGAMNKDEIAETGLVPVGAKLTNAAGGKDGNEQDKILVAARGPREREVDHVADNGGSKREIVPDVDNTPSINRRPSELTSDKDMVPAGTTKASNKKYSDDSKSPIKSKKASNKKDLRAKTKTFLAVEKVPGKEPKSISREEKPRKILVETVGEDDDVSVDDEVGRAPDSVKSAAAPKASLVGRHTVDFFESQKLRTKSPPPEQTHRQESQDANTPIGDGSKKQDTKQTQKVSLAGRNPVDFSSVQQKTKDPVQARSSATLTASPIESTKPSASGKVEPATVKAPDGLEPADLMDETASLSSSKKPGFFSKLLPTKLNAKDVEATDDGVVDSEPMHDSLQREQKLKPKNAALGRLFSKNDADKKVAVTEAPVVSKNRSSNEAYAAPAANKAVSHEESPKTVLAGHSPVNFDINREQRATVATAIPDVSISEDSTKRFSGKQKGHVQKRTVNDNASTAPPPTGDRVVSDSVLSASPGAKSIAPSSLAAPYKSETASLKPADTKKSLDNPVSSALNDDDHMPHKEKKGGFGRFFSKRDDEKGTLSAYDEDMADDTTVPVCNKEAFESMSSKTPTKTDARKRTSATEAVNDPINKSSSKKPGLFSKLLPTKQEELDSAPRAENLDLHTPAVKSVDDCKSTNQKTGGFARFFPKKDGDAHDEPSVLPQIVDDGDKKKALGKTTGHLAENLSMHSEGSHNTSQPAVSLAGRNPVDFDKVSEERGRPLSTTPPVKSSGTTDSAVVKSRPVQPTVGGKAATTSDDTPDVEAIPLDEPEIAASKRSSNKSTFMSKLFAAKTDTKVSSADDNRKSEVTEQDEPGAKDDEQLHAKQKMGGFGRYFSKKEDDIEEIKASPMESEVSNGNTANKTNTIPTYSKSDSPETREQAQKITLAGRHPVDFDKAQWLSAKSSDKAGPTAANSPGTRSFPLDNTSELSGPEGSALPSHAAGERLDAANGRSPSKKPGFISKLLPSKIETRDSLEHDADALKLREPVPSDAASTDKTPDKQRKSGIGRFLSRKNDDGGGDNDNYEQASSAPTAGLPSIRKESDISRTDEKQSRSASTKAASTNQEPGDKSYKAGFGRLFTKKDSNDDELHSGSLQPGIKPDRKASSNAVADTAPKVSLAGRNPVDFEATQKTQSHSSAKEADNAGQQTYVSAKESHHTSPPAGNNRQAAKPTLAGRREIKDFAPVQPYSSPPADAEPTDPYGNPISRPSHADLGTSLSSRRDIKDFGPTTPYDSKNASPIATTPPKKKKKGRGLTKKQLRKLLAEPDSSDSDSGAEVGKTTISNDVKPHKGTAMAPEATNRPQPSGLLSVTAPPSDNVVAGKDHSEHRRCAIDDQNSPEGGNTPNMVDDKCGGGDNNDPSADSFDYLAGRDPKERKRRAVDAQSIPEEGVTPEMAKDQGSSGGDIDDDDPSTSSFDPLAGRDPKERQRRAIDAQSNPANGDTSDTYRARSSGDGCGPDSDGDPSTSSIDPLAGRDPRERQRRAINAQSVLINNGRSGEDVELDDPSDPSGSSYDPLGGRDPKERRRRAIDAQSAPGEDADSVTATEDEDDPSTSSYDPLSGRNPNERRRRAIDAQSAPGEGDQSEAAPQDEEHLTSSHHDPLSGRDPKELHKRAIDAQSTKDKNEIDFITPNPTAELIALPPSEPVEEAPKAVTEKKKVKSKPTPIVKPPKKVEPEPIPVAPPVKPVPVPEPEEAEDESEVAEDVLENRIIECFIWYARMGQPDRNNMKRRIAAKQHEFMDIIPNDVDLLPWNSTGSLISVKNMNAFIFANDSKTSAEERKLAMKDIVASAQEKKRNQRALKYSKK